MAILSMMDVDRVYPTLSDIKRSHRIVIIWCCVYAFFWTTASFFLDPTVPYDAIEALNWASNGEWGSPKNPWFVGWVSRVFLYSPSPEFSSMYWYLSHYTVISVGMLGCYRLTYKLSKSISLSWLGLLILNLSGVINFDAIPYNDNYLLFGTWPWLLLLFIKSVWEEPRWWLLFGLTAGCSAMAKYTTFAPIMMIFIVSLTVKSVRRAWNEPYFYAAILIFVTLTIPNLFWMVDNDFSSIKWVESQVATQFNLSSWLSLLLVFYPLVLLGIIIVKRSVKLSTYVSEQLKITTVILFLPLFIIMGWFTFHSGGRLVEWLHPFFMPAPAILVAYLSPNTISSLSRIINTLMVISITIFGGYIFVLTMNVKNAGEHLSGVKSLSREAKAFWNENNEEKLTLVGGDDLSQWFTFYIAPHPKVTRRWNNDTLPNVYNRHITSEQITRQGALLVGKVGEGCQEGVFAYFIDEWMEFKPTIIKEVFYQRSPKEVKERVCLGIVRGFDPIVPDTFSRFVA